MGRIRQYIWFSTFFLLLLLLTPSVIMGATLQEPGELEAFFDGILTLQLKQYQVPGATIAVVDADEILFSKGYGYANLDTQTPMDVNKTLHRPGSNTKLLVWTAVMQLVETQKLDLYADINTYLDFVISDRVLGGQTSPPITLHHLLTHTAGFEDEIAHIFVEQASSLTSLSQYLQEHQPARVYVPGTLMTYSNYGTALAAYIVERASGMPFHEYVQEHIFTPLKMNSSTFAQPLPEDLNTQMATGYLYRDGSYIPTGFEFVQAYPAGGLTSSTTDMAKLLMSQINLGFIQTDIEEETTETKRILQQQTAELMQTQQFSPVAQFPGMTYGLIEANYNGHRVLSHGGNTFGFTTGLYFLPEQQVGIYISYNAPTGDAARSSLFAAFMDRYFPSETIAITPQPLSDTEVQNYLGIFHDTRSNRTGIERLLTLAQSMKLGVDPEGYLLLNIAGQTTKYGKIAPTTFQEVHGQEKIVLTFTEGKVSRIHFPGPFTWVRSPWYQTLPFISALLALSLLTMFLAIIGWIRQIFSNKPTHPFLIPKLIGVIFVVLFLSVLVFSLDIITTIHPSFGVPTFLLESVPTLKTTLFLAKVVSGLSLIMLLITLYIWLTSKGTIWQRVYYSLLTLSSLSVIWIFWQFNFI